MIDALHELFDPSDALPGTAHIMVCLVELMQAFEEYEMKDNSSMHSAIDAMIKILENEKQNYV